MADQVCENIYNFKHEKNYTHLRIDHHSFGR